MLFGGATATAIGVATGVGGPILAARAALGATTKTVSGDVMDKMKKDDQEKAEAEADQIAPAAPTAKNEPQK